MPKRLRTWIATPAETRTIRVVTSLCIAVAIGALLWPQIRPASDAGKPAASIESPAVAVKPQKSAHHSVRTSPVAEPGKAAGPAEQLQPVPPPLPASAPPKQPSSPVASKTVASGYYVQLGAFRDQKRARTLSGRLSPTWETHIASRPNGMLAVWVGPYATSGEASRAREKIASVAKLKGFVVKH
ncbi:MAG: SPOR domain-containing protein [Mariprofundaceae bacterium]|nr:SPOR domain-containing protein [Mariprofundaceae bacterium]